MDVNHNQKLKFLLIGESDSGKTSLIARYCGDNDLKPKPGSIGIDFKLKMIERDGEIKKLLIWDTCGEEKFISITKSYFRGCSGILLTCDMSSINNIFRTEFWYKECKNNSPDVPIILVGTKCDLVNEISEDVLSQFAYEKKLQYIITSSKINKNVDEAFELLINEAIIKMKNFEDNFEERIQILQNPHEQKTRCC